MYIFIAMGFVAGRTKKVNSESLATLLIYFIVPVVVLLGVTSTPLNLSRILLPFFVALFCAFIGLTFRILNKKSLTTSRLGIWSYAVGSGNSGYFGIPLTFFLLGPDFVGITLLIALGFMIYENTFGFYFVARAHHTAGESLIKVISLPSIWAFILAIILQKAEVNLSATWEDVYKSFRGSYTVLGMMMLGLGVSQLKTFKVDIKLLLKVFNYKFLIWPVLMFAFLWLNKTYFHFFDGVTSKVLFLISLVPLPANSVAYATALKTEPEETSWIVLLSTFWALFFIPLVWGYFSYFI
ncbi:MAG: hypothetical protein IPM57_03685 [Oligoflexia bacterium]|nr:hypothetical protein [Oligoflexia bacterium]